MTDLAGTFPVNAVRILFEVLIAGAFPSKINVLLAKDAERHLLGV